MNYFSLKIFFKTETRSNLFLQVKLDLMQLEGIIDDIDFCIKLAKEEKMIILPGKLTFETDKTTAEQKYLLLSEKSIIQFDIRFEVIIRIEYLIQIIRVSDTDIDNNLCDLYIQIFDIF